MQFQVPQFIDVENKIVGPLTLKQFFFLAAAGGASFLLFFVLATWLWVIVAMILTAGGLTFAFIKYNGQPLVKIAFNALGFLWKPRLYLWQREAEEKILAVSQIEAERKSLRDYFSEMPSVKKLMVDLITSRNPIPKREKTGYSFRRGEKFSAARKTTGEKEIARRVDYR